mmetsp:Transcript_33985/g.109536  ORF Transcript_33985/g.109536 Transcript_33985/m.109536 type:complete len:225 (+) Transcript_33985:581-1255(+)
MSAHQTSSRQELDHLALELRGPHHLGECVQAALVDACDRGQDLRPVGLARAPGLAGIKRLELSLEQAPLQLEIRSKDDRHEATRENCNPEGEQRHVGIGRAGQSAQVIPVEEGAARWPHGHAGGTEQDHEVPDGDARAKAKREEENWPARVEGAVDGELIHTPETSKVLLVPKRHKLRGDGEEASNAPDAEQLLLRVALVDAHAVDEVDALAHTQTQGARDEGC